MKCFSYPVNRIWRFFCFLADVPTDIIEFQTLRMFLSWNIILWWYKCTRNARSNSPIVLTHFWGTFEKANSGSEEQHFFQVWFCLRKKPRINSVRVNCVYTWPFRDLFQELAISVGSMLNLIHGVWNVYSLRRLAANVEIFSVTLCRTDKTYLLIWIKYSKIEGRTTYADVSSWFLSTMKIHAWLSNRHLACVRQKHA